MTMSADDEAELKEMFDALAAQYEDTGASDEDAGEEEEESDDDESEEDESEEDDSDDDAVDLGDGTTLTRNEILQLRSLRTYLDANPAIQSSIDSATTAVTRQPPAAVPPPQEFRLEVPEGLDLDDPTIKALWDQQELLARDLNNQRQELARRNLVETTDQVERAIVDWNAKYKVDTTQLSALRDRAAKTTMVSSLVSAGKSVYEAVNQAMETAFWSDDKLRTQYLNAAAEDAKRTARTQRSKTQKLSALAGRGTSAGSSKPPAEMTRDERREAMINEIADQMARG